MRRGRIFIYLGLILILGLVAVAVFVFRPTPQPSPDVTLVPGQTPGPSEPTQPTNREVVVLVQPVAQGQRITRDFVETRQISEDDFSEGMFESVSELEGGVARFDLPAGTYLSTENVVFLKFEPSEHSVLIPPGKVAVSIPIDRLGSVANGIQSGDHVNVIITLLFTDLDSNFQTKLPNNASSVIAPGPALLLTIDTPETETAPAQTTANVTVSEFLQTLTAQIATGGSVSPIGRLELDQSLGQPFYVVPSEEARPRLVAQTLLQDVIVLQFGDFTLEEVVQATAPAEAEPTPTPEAPPAEEGAAAQPETTVEKPDNVTLIVSPQEAVTLNYLLQYEEGARLSLALRSSGDSEIIPTEAVTLQFLLDQYNIQLPAKLPYGIEPRIDTVIDPILINDQPTPETNQ